MLEQYAKSQYTMEEDSGGGGDGQCGFRGEVLRAGWQEDPADLNLQLTAGS